MRYKQQKPRYTVLAFCFLCTLLMLLCVGCTKQKDKIESVEQLNQSKYTISLDPGAAATIVATEMFPEANLVYNNTITDAYLAVEQGKSDAFVFGKLYLQYAVASGSFDNLAIMDETLAEADIAVGINPKRADLLPEVNAFIKQFRQNGTIDEMYNRWVVKADTNMPEIPKPENPDRVIRIGTSGLVEPMNYYDKNQELTGFDVELIHRLAYYMNAEVKLEAMSFDALVASLESGKLDMVISDLNVTEERKEVILMSDPYMVSETGILVQKDRLEENENREKTITRLSELDGCVIAMLDGTSYDVDIKERFPNAEIQYYPSYVDCIMAVKSGKANAYITEEPLAVRQTEGSGDMKYLSEPLLQEKYAFMLNKENLELKLRINEVLEKMKNDGTLEALQQEWIYGEETPSVDRDPNADTSKGTLKVITSSDAEPFCYIMNGEVVGYEVELIVKVAEQLGYAVDIQLTDFSAFMPAVIGNKIDIALGCISVTPEREESVGFSDIECESGVVAVVSSGQDQQKGFFASLKDSFRRTFIKENRWKLLGKGLLVTIQLSVVSMILGTLLGFAVSFVLRSRNVVLRKVSNGIATFLDGMPLVVILMVLYYVVFQGVDISPVWVGIIGFTIDFANVVSGLLNTGVSAVDKGQLEAASSMGYNKLQIFWKITFPQAAKQMFSQYEGAVVGLVKGTAIVGYITVEDLTKAGDIIRSRTYEAFFPLLVTAVLYFLIAYLFITLLRRVDIKMDPKRRPRKVKGVRLHDND